MQDHDRIYFAQRAAEEQELAQAASILMSRKRISRCSVPILKRRASGVASRSSSADRLIRIL